MSKILPNFGLKLTKIGQKLNILCTYEPKQYLCGTGILNTFPSLIYYLVLFAKNQLLLHQNAFSHFPRDPAGNGSFFPHSRGKSKLREFSQSTFSSIFYFQICMHCLVHLNVAKQAQQQTYIQWNSIIQSVNWAQEMICKLI